MWYYGFTLDVRVSVNLSVSRTYAKYILRTAFVLMSVYSVIAKNWCCGVKNWCCGVKKDQRKIKGIT